MLDPNSVHKEYQRLSYYWKRCRDTYEGQKTVHDAGEEYLPRIDKQSDESYASYKARARFFNAVRRTVDGLTGLVFRKDPNIDADGIDDFVMDVSLQQQSIEDYCQSVLNEALIVSAGGTLVDHPMATGELTVAQAEKLNLRPVFKYYSAESVKNWSYKTINNISVLVDVLLEEEYQDKTGNTRTLIRNLTINDEGYYEQIITRENPIEGEQKIEFITPLMDNNPLDFIPFVFHRTRSGLKNEIPVMSDLVDTNIHHYQLEADHANGLRYITRPTPYITGADGPTPSGKDSDGNDIKGELSLGEVWFVPEASSKVGILEFSGSGLLAVREQLNRLESTMAQQGAKVLQPENTGGFETATSAIIGAKGETSLLSRIVNVLSNQMTTALKWAAMWQGKDDMENYSASFNSDFLPVQLTAQDLTALVGAWQAGAIGPQTLFENLKRGEIIDGDKQWEDEMQQIENQLPPKDNSLGETGNENIDNGDSDK